MNCKRSDVCFKLFAVLFQMHILCWMLYDVTAQYDYENEGSIVAAMMAGGAPYVGSSTASRSLSSGTGQLSQQDKMQWDRTNALTLEKCLQLQKLAIKKRNFGLEIPEILLTHTPKSKENFDEIRNRMAANGKRK